MRIDFQHTPQAAAEDVSNRNTVASNPGTPAGKVTSEHADHSASHVNVKALEAGASQVSEVRSERVQSLRQAIAGGQYQPRPEQIAGALFSHMVDIMRQ